MKLPSARVLVITGIASITLVSLSAVLGGTKLEWLGLPFWALGFFAAAAVFPQGVEGDHAISYLVLVCILNFVFTWLGVLVLVKCFDNFTQKKRQG
jgi:hypothetical protein